MHLQHWAIILGSKFLLTNTKCIFWVDVESAGMQQWICTISCKDSPRLYHPQRREEQQAASPLQEYEILFKSPAGFPPVVPPTLSDT